ncbi:hypothetical protein AC249_AIPGENE28741 [Exaiptasia diaphana]|nr:hypothetical protein AC249_AIPGENE28741 [Exaiptasia diaphana]
MSPKTIEFCPMRYQPLLYTFSINMIDQLMEGLQERLWLRKVKLPQEQSQLDPVPCIQQMLWRPICEDEDQQESTVNDVSEEIREWIVEQLD